jgi:ribA/ribD-fused uncharacterized protein
MVHVIDQFDGTDYAFLSNFYASPIIWTPASNGRLSNHRLAWPTVEHAYQAAKLDPELPDLLDRLADFQLARNAGMVKKLGKAIALRPDWDDVKIDIMRSLVILKFHTFAHLRQKLMATGDAELIEGNWWGDVFWGICRGVGRNELGKLLVEVRTGMRTDYRIAIACRPRIYQYSLVAA